MQYSVATFDFHFREEWQADVFAQTLFDLGFDTINGNKAYIPTDILNANRHTISAQLANTEGAILVGIQECPDENWNAVWESEHPIQELPMGVQIIPHCAFGAGHHETTSMMIESLIEAFSGKDSYPKGTIISEFRKVLDHGTGTGVLAIFAKRLGAAEVVAIDIDDKSVLNARENAAFNDVEIDVRLGDCPPEESFDLILANIHRNILLANMARYAACLRIGGQLWLSGFYEEDCPILIEAAEAEGLQFVTKHANGEWRMLILKNF